jgi:hypothetical protein
MSSTAEIILEVLLFVFVSCGFVACVGCTSALLKKYYDKYVLNLPEIIELPPTVFQDVEGRYAKAAAVVVSPSVEFIEVFLYETNEEDAAETNRTSVVASVV